MRKNQKYAALVGIVAMVGMALWMREIASWRPVLVARLDLMPAAMSLSKDGRLLAATGFERIPPAKNRTYRSKSVIIDLQTFNVRSDASALKDFDTQSTVPKFPRLVFRPPNQVEFWRAPGQKVILSGKSATYLSDFTFYPANAAHMAWSKARREVYREANGQIFIWDWNTGALKKRFRYRKTNSFRTIAFSPDAQSLLTFDQSSQGINTLRRYDVPSGKETGIIHQGGRGKSATRAENFGWSPDGHYLWFVRRNYLVSPVDFNVVRASDSKKIWSAPCTGISKWLPDGRIGLIQKDGFSFRDATGRETGHTFGPLAGATDWEASPDGNFIYSAEKPGFTIRRWRAR